jgi:hypothetical protein
VGKLMGEPKAKLTAVILEQGQNEGIERTVLPLPQLSYLQNARMRKNGRIGKRFGYVYPGGTSPGGVNPRCIGGALESSFIIVDDFCATYDQTAQAFIPGSQIDNPVLMPRVAGAVSGWLTDTSFFPIPTRTPQGQDTTPCAVCYAFGYLWTVATYTDQSFTTDKIVRITAVDPHDQTMVVMNDFRATNRGFGGLNLPKLVFVNNTLVLTYLYTSAVGNTAVYGRRLTAANGAWSAEQILTATTATAYDVSSYDATRFILAVCQAPTSAVVLYTTAWAGSASQNIVDSSGNPLTSISCVGAGAEVYVGYGCAATPASKVRVFTTNLAGTVGTGTLSAADAVRPLLCLLQTGGVRAVFSSTVSGSGNAGSFSIADVSAGAAVGFVAVQPCFYPISMPFSVGALAYVWAKIETGGPSYATLLRLPTIAVSPVSCPLQFSAQDILTAPTFNINGVSAVAQFGSSATYATVIASQLAQGAMIGGVGVQPGFEYRVLQLKHFSDSAQNRSVGAVAIDSSSYVPLAALTRVDDRGAVEEGFVHQPVMRTPVPAGGGSLTASSDYYYTAVFKSRNTNGRFEVSAPADPVKVTMGAGQNQNTLTIVQLGATQRPSYSIEIYRTLSNDKTFYLVAIISPGIGATGTVSYVDQLSDAVAGIQPVLYTQVGQQLANTFPPGGRFACAGGARLFVGGLIRSDVVHASKLILGDQSPSFADRDAFRIVLPDSCTGIGWLDSLVLFTQEGIYVASGDGPDDSGVGDFGTLTRLPFPLGCIEPRSVFACDEGLFFQTARGLYLLPRGFGTPQAVDVVMSTLATYSIICGVAALVKNTEQTVRWICVNASNQGVQIVYDLAHKVWSVDQLADTFALGTPAAQYGIGNWYGGELAMFTSVIGGGDGTPIKLTNSTFSDGGQPIAMLARTGDVRPFGPTEQGNVHRLSTLLELRSACTLAVDKTSDRGTAHQATRVYTAVGPDTVVGELSTILTDLGSTEQRSLTALRIDISETSTLEGVALIALALEHGAPEGARLNKLADRIV